MFRSATGIALIVASLIAANLPARAAPEPGAFLTQLMGRKPRGKTVACFARTYDAAWLAAHPGENIEHAHVLAVSYENALQLHLGFRLRDRSENSSASANAERICPCAGARAALDWAKGSGSRSKARQPF